MKKILIGSILLLLLNCRGGGSSPQDGSSCSALSQPTGEVVINCEDGTTGVVEKAPGCLLKPDPAGRGILVNCPPSQEWLLIRNGDPGKPGKDCVVLKTTVASQEANHYLTCDGKKSTTLVKDSGLSDNASSCSNVGLVFFPSSGYCRGTVP